VFMICSVMSKGYLHTKPSARLLCKGLTKLSDSPVDEG
jgi:hypothetical protein